MLLKELFAKTQLGAEEKQALAGLNRADIRTHDRVMSLLMKALSAKEPVPQSLADIYTALFTQRSILANDTRERDLLLLRQLKSIYTRQYGFDDGIAKCITL